MTTHAHDPSQNGSDVHAFDGEPARELPPDEPKTPAYIPAIGLSLFLVVLVGALVTTRSDGDDTAAKTEALPSARPPASAPAAPVVSAQVRPQGSTSAAPARKFSETEIKDLQKKAAEMRRRREEQGKAPAAPAKKQ